MYVASVKSTVKISSIFVALLENTNFMLQHHHNSLHPLNSNLAFLISASVTVFRKGHKNLILSKNLTYKMLDIIFKDVNLTKRAPAWKFFHSNEEYKLAKCQ